MFLFLLSGAVACVGKQDLKEGDKAELLCEVKYQGELLPEPEWISPDVKEGVEYVNSDELLTAGRKVVFTARPDMNGVTFTCQVTVNKKVLQTTCERKITVKCKWMICSCVVAFLRMAA